jgi:hypothetical protein
MQVDLRLRSWLSSALRAPSRIGKQIQPPVSKTHAQHRGVQIPHYGNQLNVTLRIFELSTGTTSQFCSHPKANLDNKELHDRDLGKDDHTKSRSRLGLDALLAPVLLSST